MLKLKERHGSPYYYLRGTVRGISIDESTGVTIDNKTAANEVRIRREAEVLEESIHGKRAVATFSQAALSYIEAGGEKTYLLPIIKHFGTTKLAAIGQDEIDLAARKLYPNHATSTQNRCAYTPVSSVLQHAVKRGWCSAIRIERPEQPQPRVRWLTYDEAQRLIAACDEWFRPLVVFLLYTGARVGEALWLDWKNLDLDRRHVQFLDTKNGTNRGVPLHASIVDALRGNNERVGYVFTNRHGAPFRLIDESAARDGGAGNRIAYSFSVAVDRAGLTDFHPHDCRHTWATWHYQANRDLGALQKLGGWKTLAMVMRYAHTNVAELDATIDRIK